MDLRGNWNYPTTVRFGAGRVSEIGEAVKAAKMTQPAVRHRSGRRQDADDGRPR